MIRTAAFALAAAVALTPMIPAAHAQNAPPPQYVNGGATNVNQPAPMANGSPTGWWQDAGGRSPYPYKPGFTPVPAPPPRSTAY